MSNSEPSVGLDSVQESLQHAINVLTAIVDDVKTGNYTKGERLPIEVLVFEMSPEHVDEYLAIDHEIWTLGQAQLSGFEQIPFLSKEVWLDDSRPGRVSIVFVWESLDAWTRVGSAETQQRLQAEFDARFKHPVKLVEAWHEETNFGIHRWSRFER